MAAKMFEDYAEQGVQQAPQIKHVSLPSFFLCLQWQFQPGL